VTAAAPAADDNTGRSPIDQLLSTFNTSAQGGGGMGILGNIIQFFIGKMLFGSLGGLMAIGLFRNQAQAAPQGPAGPTGDAASSDETAQSFAAAARGLDASAAQQAAQNDPLFKNGAYLRNTIKHEGKNTNAAGDHVAYQDSYGKWTIGYGHLMDAGDKRQITQAEAEELLRQDIVEHLEYLYEKWPGFQSYHPALKQAMFDVMFNVGLEAENNPFDTEHWPGLASALEGVRANPRDANAWQMVKLNITRRDISVTVSDEKLKELTALREPGSNQNIPEYLRQRADLGLDGIYAGRNAFAAGLVEQAERAAMASPAPAPAP
jgi:GH24 family phage-related lysozyme (muramidase)